MTPSSSKSPNTSSRTSVRPSALACPTPGDSRPDSETVEMLSIDSISTVACERGQYHGLPFPMPRGAAMSATMKITADPEIIRAAVAILIPADGVTELRIPEAGRGRTLSGYYDDLDRLVADAALLNQKFGTTYILLNPPNPAVLARRVNRFEDYAKQTTSDADIAHRMWFLIDQDAVRPSGISASDEEHAA